MVIGLLTAMLFLNSIYSMPTNPYVAIFPYSGDLFCVLWYDSTQSCTNNSISWSKSNLPIQIDNIKYIQGVNSRDGICRVTFIVKNIGPDDKGVYEYKHVDSDINGLYGGLWHE